MRRERVIKDRAERFLRTAAMAGVLSLIVLAGQGCAVLGATTKVAGTAVTTATKMVGTVCETTCKTAGKVVGTAAP